MASRVFSLLFLEAKKKEAFVSLASHDVVVYSSSAGQNAGLWMMK